MAAAPNDAPVVQMENYLTCSICLETLQDPRTLPCFHSFCKCCLEKFVKGQREKAEGKVIEVFNCPECRTEFELKEGQQVEEMTRNHFIVNMLEMLAIQRRPNQMPCNSCELKPPAVCRCTTCEKYLCRECLTVHGKWPAFNKHTVFTMDELVKPENQAKIKGKFRCKKHENKSLKFYCETCKELVCTHCIVLEHKEGHSCLSTETVGEKKRELVKSSSVFLNDQLKEGNDLLQNIDHVTQKLKNNAKIAKDEISQQKENILKAFTEKLEEKAELIMKEVDEKYNETQEFLVKQKDEVKAYLDKVKGSVELTKNILEKGTHEEILSFQNEIEENLKKVKNERPTQMKPVHDGNIQYKANPVDNIDTTSNLDKMGEVGKLCIIIQLTSLMFFFYRY